MQDPNISAGTIIARAASVFSDGVVLVLTFIRTRAKGESIDELLQPVHTIRSDLIHSGKYAFSLNPLAKFRACDY